MLQRLLGLRPVVPSGVLGQNQVVVRAAAYQLHAAGQ